MQTSATRSFRMGGLWALAAAILFFAPMASAQVSEAEARQIAKDAYVYAYPLVLHDVTIRRLANVSEPTGALGEAPFNQFAHARDLSTPAFRTVIRPNVDTLYSAAWLDLDPEPLVLSVPAVDRYFLLPLASLWTDVFAVPGTRTTGRNTARNFLIVGPRWRGTPPAGMEVIRSPTRIAAIGGRTQVNGPTDLDAVRRIQQTYRLTPLSAWGKAAWSPPKGTVDPNIQMKLRPPVQVANMDAPTFLAKLAELLKDNPPGPLDYPMVHRLERIGFHVGQGYELAAQPASLRQGVERGAADGKAEVEALGRRAAGVGTAGWVYSTTVGAYGVNYAERAAIARSALGMNLAQDAIYPSIATDSEGRPLDGAHRYVVHFEKGQLPPVGAFWSLTAYDRDGYLIANSLNRQALGDRDPLRFNADGSLDLLVQVASPGREGEADWLPVSEGPFNLMLRLYMPDESVLDRSWTPPPVKRLD